MEGVYSYNPGACTGDDDDDRNIKTHFTGQMPFLPPNHISTQDTHTLRFIRNFSSHVLNSHSRFILKLHIILGQA